MAGVEFAKFSLSNLSEMDIHFDLNKRKVCDHSNISIDKNLVEKDYFINASNWEEVKERINSTVEEADKKNPPKRVRKDRKHLFTLCVTCPPELEGTSQEDLFYKKAFEVLSQEVPIEAGEVHKDEKHQYYDTKKKSMEVSRNHCHFFGACLTNDGRINAHDLINQERCQRVNDVIQQMCLDEFGISYQTGLGRSGEKKTVEQLKAESETSYQAGLVKEKIQQQEQLSMEISQKISEIAEMNSIVQMNTSIIKKQDEKIITQKEAIQENEKVIEEQFSSIKTNKKKIREQEEKVTDLGNEIQTRQNTLESLCNSLFTRFKEAYEAVSKLLENFFQNETERYADVMTEMIEPMRTGSQAINVLERAVREKTEPEKKYIKQLETSTIKLEKLVEENEIDEDEEIEL